MLAASNEKKESEKSENKERKLINFNQKILPKSIATIIVCGLKFFAILMGKIS